MARSLSAAEWAVLCRPDYEIHARLTVENATLHELFGIGNPLRKATVVADIDAPVQTGTFTLDLGEGAASLSPYLSTGAQIRGVPVFGEDRAVGLEIQCVLPGTAVNPFNGWRSVFQGGMDTAEVSPGDSTVTIHCRDRLGALQLTEIENITTNLDGVDQWGFPVTGGLLQDMIQQILDDAFTYAYGGPYPEPFRVVGTPPTDTATDYWQQRTNLLQAIRDLGIGKNGWDLRGKWDLPSNGPDTFVLAYYLPDRPGAGAVTRINRSHNGVDLRYLGITGLAFDIVGVKNVAEITPADAARVPVVTEHADSILRFGRRFLAVSEDAASHIDTAGEAGTLGEIIVTDLASGKAAITLALPFVWAFEINDLFSVGSDGRTFDREDLVFAATHTELTYEGGKGSLTLSGREAGAASQLVAWRKAGVQYQPKTVYIKDGPPVGPARDGTFWAEYAP